MKSAHKAKKHVNHKAHSRKMATTTYIWGAVLLFLFLGVLAFLFSRVIGPTGPVPSVQAQVVLPLIPTNLLTNNSLSYDYNKDGTPDNWDRSDLQSTDIIDCTTAHTGSCAFKITNSGGSQKALHQMIAVSAKAGSKITLSAWSKASKVSNSGSGVYWGQVVLYNTDGTITYGTAEEIPNKGNILEFGLGSHDFQLETKSFIAPKAFRAIDFRLRFTASGTVWFDDAALSIAE
jgi:hypothetical protein